MEVLREIRQNIRVYLNIFLIFFLFFILLQYRIFTTLNVSYITPILIYSTLVFLVIALRYFGSLFHYSERYDKFGPRPKQLPSVDIVIPAYNEGKAIYGTVKSIVRSDYPNNKMNIVLINDGSTDNTLKWILKAAKDFRGFNIKSVNLEHNAGKKEAMAIGIRSTRSKYVIFIDSDSSIDNQCIKEIIRPFYGVKNKRVGAVSGHAMVQNSDNNLLTKMQEIRYFNAFRSAKAVESLVGFVSCCPGCCSAYRRKALLSVIKPWLEQSFLGARCTYGDDRSLTNMVLKKSYKAVYNEKAIVFTIVPETIKKFNKQQIRWKKSWLRESVVVLSFVWKRHPLAAFLMIIDTITPFFTPLVMFYILIYLTILNFNHFWLYILGISIFATCMGLFYKIHNKDAKKWLSGAYFSSLMSILLIWHLPYALATLRDTKWGTR